YRAQLSPPFCKIHFPFLFSLFSSCHASRSSRSQRQSRNRRPSNRGHFFEKAPLPLFFPRFSPHIFFLCQFPMDLSRCSTKCRPILSFPFPPSHSRGEGVFSCLRRWIRIGLSEL